MNQVEIWLSILVRKLFTTKFWRNKEDSYGRG